VTSALSTRMQYAGDRGLVEIGLSISGAFIEIDVRWYSICGSHELIGAQTVMLLSIETVNKTLSMSLAN